MQMLATVDLRRSHPDFVVHEAAHYARLAGATVDLLFVSPVSPPDPEHQRRLEALMELIPAPQQGRVVHPSGPVVDIIAAHSARYDLVVVGPREPGPVERVFLGSIAARIVRQARSPILVVRTRTHGEGPRAVVGVDLKNPQRVVEEAARWIEHLGGTIDLVNVDSVSLPRVPDQDLQTRLERERAQYRKRDQERLEVLLARVHHEHRGSVRLASGEPGPALNELAAEYDMVMLGCLGRRGMARLILGSVAETVVRGAPVTVLVFPPHLDAQVS